MKLTNIKRPKIRVRRPRIRIRWRKKTSRWVIGAAVLFFLSLLALQLVMMNYTKSILQNVLNLQLQQATNGKYISSFDDIEISYTRKNFIVRNLRLVSSRQTDSLSANQPNSYDLLIPEVQINGINLRKAYLDNFLDIQSLRLVNPTIELQLNLDAEKNKAADLFKEELYKLLPQSIDGLRVGQIHTSEATVHLLTRKKGHKSELKASSVEIELSNFLLHTKSFGEQEKVFFADHFFVAADRMEGALSDSLYQLRVGSLKVSSKDSSAFMSRFSLQPVNSPQEVAENSPIPNLYALEFPQVYLYGLSFPDLYHHKDLLAKEVTVISPDMKLYNLQPPKEGEKENFRLENLYPVIDKLLNSLQIQNVYLRNGQLQIDELRGKLRHKLISGIKLAHVHDFLLDSTASRQKNKLFYSDGLNIELQNYSLRLSDDLHLLNSDKLVLSSEQNLITAEGFKILPDSGSSRMEENLPLYRGDAALIHISGVDLLRAYNDNHLLIDSLLVLQPTFRLSTIQRQEREAVEEDSQEEGFREEDLYGLIKNYLYTLQINNLAVRQGRFHIREAKRSVSDAFITQVKQARLWNFRLDSASAYQMNKLFYANDFELEIADYSQALPDDIHTITAANIRISTLSDRIIISDVHIKPLNYQFPYTNLSGSPVKTLLRLEVPELRLEGVDILKTYLQKQLEVEQVFIPSPLIALGTLVDKQSERMNIIKSSALYDLMKEYLELIRVKDLHLQQGSINLAFYDRNGQVQVSGEQTGVHIENFRFDSLTSSNPKRLFFADNVRVEVAGYETRLSDNIHIIKAENVVASTSEQEIKAENVAINTSQEAFSDEELLVRHQKKGFVQLLLPELRISGVNFDEAYYQESLQVDSVLAAEPHVQYTYIPEAILQNKKNKVRLKQTELYEGLAPYLKEIIVNHLQVKNGHFYSFQQQNNQPQKHIALKGLSLDLQDFHVDSAAVYDNQRFFYTNNIRLLVNSYQQELLDQEHSLTAENLFLSTTKNQARADSIRLQPKSGILQKRKASLAGNNQYFIFLPALAIEGIQFDDIFRENRLFIEELSLQQPSITVEQHAPATEANPAGKSKLKDYKLNELLQGNLQSFTVKEARLIEGKGTYTLFKDKKKLQLRSRNFKAKVENFHLEEGQGSRHKPFYADNIQVHFSAIERPLADSLHLLTIDEINYSSREKLLQAEGISLKPRAMENRAEQMRKAGTDRLYTLQIPLSQVKGLEADKLDQDSLFVQYLLFQNPSIEITRFPALSPKKEATEEVQSWQQLLKKEFELVQADSIVVENATAVYLSQHPADTSRLTVRNIDGVAYNFRFDSLAGKESSRLLFSDKIKVQAQDYYTTLSDDLYELRIKTIQLDSDKRLAVADSISLTPLLSREAFAREKGYETDQFTFRNRQLRVENLNYESLLKNGSLLADSLLLDGFYLMVHRDKRQPYPKEHYPKMPQDMLRSLDTPLLILGVAIKEGYIGYSERVKGTRQPGFIDLTDFRIVSDTLTNHPGLLKKGVTTNIALHSYLMGTGKLSARFKIPLNDPLNRHSFSGRLDEMYLPDFNPILENTVFIKIRDGHASYINFAVNADMYGAEGEMEFRYSGLRVALVNRKTGKTGGLTKEIGSLIANLFVVNSSNVEENNKALRKGKMEYERDENRSTVNYWIKTLVNGFKSSIGI